MMRSEEQGITLVVSLIMLIMLTLIVVSAVRFGNINLRIAGNAQSEAEALAASQIGLESAVAEIEAAPNIGGIVARSNVSYSTGGATYQVDITKPDCLATKNINNTSLDKDKPNDKVCYSDPGTAPILTVGGSLVVISANCKDQLWEVRAAVDNDTKSSVKVSVAQGVAVRTGPAVTCP